MSGQQVPDNIEALLAIFENSEAPQDDARCECDLCGKLNHTEDMRLFRYTNDETDPDKKWVYVCSCVDPSILDFVSAKGLNLRGLNLDQVRNIVTAYFDGTYLKWHGSI